MYVQLREVRVHNLFAFGDRSSFLGECAGRFAAQLVCGLACGVRAAQTVRDVLELLFGHQTPVRAQLHVLEPALRSAAVGPHAEVGSVDASKDGG